MRAIGFLVVAAGLALGCGKGGPAGEAPLDDSLLVRALSESHLATARATRTGEDVDSLRSATLARLGVDTTDLSRSIEIYTRHPDEFARLYEQVTDHLRARQQEFVPTEVSPELLSDTLLHVDPDLHHRGHD